MSDYPDKGFAYCGTIVSNADIGLEGRTSQDAINYYGNNHGSIVEILVSGIFFITGIRTETSSAVRHVQKKYTLMNMGKYRRWKLQAAD